MLGVSLIAVASAIVVPAYVYGSVLTSETPMPHAEYLQLRRATYGLVWSAVLLQVVSASLIARVYGNRRRFFSRALWFVGLSSAGVVGSFVIGLLAAEIVPHTVSRFALNLFK
jgi:hypothetical protein